VNALKGAQALEREHEVIQRAIAAISVIADRIRQSGSIDSALVPGICEFLRQYADMLHHAKEERSLFPLLEKRGVPASACSLAALRHEHDAGRVLVSELSGIAESKEDEARQHQELGSILQKIVKLYIEHIRKEDYLLIPMAAKVVSMEDDEALVREFESVDASFGLSERRMSEDFVAQLEAQAAEGGAAT
jgi:hemerythrin-like domain-containing protein